MAVDGATARGLSAGTRALAGLSLLADRRWLDGAIAWLDGGLMLAASGLSRIQTGLLHQYYAFAAAGMAALMLYAFIVFGN